MPDETTADTIDDTHPAIPKAAASAYHGLGHNSGDTEKAAPENVSDETISMHLAFAVKKAGEFSSAFKTKLAEIDITATDAISSIYIASQAIQGTTGAYDAFIEKYGITVHGNVRSRSHPIVSFCLLQLDRAQAKSTTTKWSVVIDHGIACALTPDHFGRLVRTNGIENLYQKHKPSTRDDALTDKQQKELAAIIVPNRIDAPVFSDSEILGNAFGDRIAVVNGDGAGNFRVRAVLDSSPQEVSRFLASIARKKLAR